MPASRVLPSPEAADLIDLAQTLAAKELVPNVDRFEADEVFPREIFRPSRRWAQPQFPDLRYWNEPGKGGHFAAFEQPQVFVEEVRAAFRAFG